MANIGKCGQERSGSTMKGLGGVLVHDQVGPN